MPRKTAALPRLPRRRARSPEGERAAVEVAAGGTPFCVAAAVPRAMRRDGAIFASHAGEPTAAEEVSPTRVGFLVLRMF